MSNTESIRKPLIAVIGDAWLPKEDDRIKHAFDCGKLIIEAGYQLVTGGMGGIMESACKGARNAANYQPGCIIGLLPGFDPSEANDYVDIPIATGLGPSRNLIIANADAVVAIGGGPGTLTEIAFAWQLGRLIIGLKVKGWSGKLADQVLDERRIRYKDIPNDRIYGCDHSTEVISTIQRLLPNYLRQYHGIINTGKVGNVSDKRVE